MRRIEVCSRYSTCAARTTGAAGGERSARADSGLGHRASGVGIEATQVSPASCTSSCAQGILLTQGTAGRWQPSTLQAHQLVQVLNLWPEAARLHGRGEDDAARGQVVLHGRPQVVCQLGPCTRGRGSEGQWRLLGLQAGSTSDTLRLQLNRVAATNAGQQAAHSGRHASAHSAGRSAAGWSSPTARSPCPKRHCWGKTRAPQRPPAARRLSCRRTGGWGAGAGAGKEGEQAERRQAQGGPQCQPVRQRTRRADTAWPKATDQHLGTGAHLPGGAPSSSKGGPGACARPASPRRTRKIMLVPSVWPSSSRLADLMSRLLARGGEGCRVVVRMQAGSRGTSGSDK